MTASVTEAVGATVREGTLAERIVVAAGALVLAYGLWQFVQLSMGIYGATLGDGTTVDVFQTTLTAFLAITVGLIAITLATALDLEWTTDDEH